MSEKLTARENLRTNLDLAEKIGSTKEDLIVLSQEYKSLKHNYREAFGSKQSLPQSLLETERIIGITGIFRDSDDLNRDYIILSKYLNNLTKKLDIAKQEIDKSGTENKEQVEAADGVDKSRNEKSQKNELSDLEKTGLLTQANNFDHLYILLETTGPIEGSTKDFSIDVVKNIVDEIYKKPIDERQEAQRLALKDVTKQNGLREIIARCFEAKDEELSSNSFFDNSPFNNRPGPTTTPNSIPNPKSPDTPLASPNEPKVPDTPLASPNEPKVPDPLPDSSAGAGEPAVKVENAEVDSKIEDLYNRYKNADASVFKQDPTDLNSPFKKFPDIHNDIRDVLKRAGVDEKVSDQFLDEKVTGYYHGEITLALKIKREGRTKAQFETDLPALKAEAQEKVSKIYQELLNKVKEMIEEAESKAGMDSKVSSPDKEPGTETLEKQIASCTTFDELYALLDKLREITGSHDTSYSFDQLKTQIEIIRGEVIKLIKTHPDGDINTLVEVVYNVQGNRITSTGGLREHVKKLVKQEHGLDKIEKEEPTPDIVGSKEGGLDSYREARKNLFDAKNVLLSKEEEYKKAFAVRGLISKIKGGVGVEDAKLQALKLESDSLRTAYAKALDAALQAKSDRKRTKSVLDGDGKVIGAMETDDESIFTKPKFTYATLADAKTKEHFVKKLILTPKIKNQEWIESLESPTKKTVIKGVVGFLKKHKWALRAGVIVGAGLLAGTTGGVGLGLSAAAYKTGRLGWSLKVGAAAAAATNVYGEKKWVGKAGQKLNETVEDANANFTLDNIASLNANIIKADKGVSNARRKQTAATIGAGILAGGGYSALAEGLGWDTVSPPNSGATSVPSYVESRQGTVPVDKIPEVLKPPESPVVVNENPVGNSVEAPASSPASDVILGTSFGDNVSEPEATVNNPDMTRVSSFDVNSRPDGAQINIVNNISFSGENLSDQNLETVNSIIETSVNRAYADSAHFNVDKLEKDLLAMLAAKFGSESWWPEGGIKVDLDVKSLEPTGMPDTVPVPTSLGFDVEPFKPTGMPDTVSIPEIVGENIYTVESGDTISDLINEHFAEELKKAAPGEYNEVLYQAINNVNNNPELKALIGLRNDDIDKIYPGEKLNLDVFRTEIERILSEREATVDGVNLDEVSPDEVSTDEDIIFKDSELETNTDSGWRGYEATPAQILEAGGNHEILPPTLVSSVDGQYFNQPDWKEYINQRFGSEANFNKVLNAEIAEIDNVQPGWLGSLFGGEDYTSPYKVLESMTIADLTELSKGPDFSERTFCEANNLKYETYRDWQDWVAILKDQHQGEYSDKTTWADLFKRHVAEVLPPSIKNVTS